MDALQKLVQRIRSSGFWPTVKYLIFTVLLERLGIHVSAIFVHEPGRIETPRQTNYRCTVIESIDGVTPSVRDALLEYGGEATMDDFSKSFAEKQRCALGFIDDRFGCACWFQRQKHGLFVDQPVYLIWRCFTLPSMRGRQLYPLTLIGSCVFIRQNLNCDYPIVIESSIFNKSSVKGIAKAGFERISNKIEIGRWKRFF